MQVIILDGHLKSALAAARSLGKRNVIVSVGGDRKTGMALHSRYVESSFIYPSPYEDQGAFIQAVKKEALRLGEKPVIYAFSDATWLSLYKYRDELKECSTFTYSDQKSVEIAFNKAATYSLARISGIPTIPTQAPEADSEVRQLSDELSFPVVLKSRKSVTWKDGKGIFKTAQFVHSKEELLDEFNELKNVLGESPLIQEFITGEEYGVEMLVRDGVVYAFVSHHRLKSLSPTGGASVLKETMMEGDLKNTLETHAVTLAKKLSWTGPLMVEFKVDSDSQTPYLMEINGRFWGSLPLGIAAGVDFPYLHLMDTKKNQRPDSKISGREGVVSNHFIGSAAHLMRVLIAKDKMRKELYPSRIQAAIDFIVIPRRTISDVWSFKDPMPAFAEIVDIFKRLWK